MQRRSHCCPPCHRSPLPLLIALVLAMRGQAFQYEQLPSSLGNLTNLQHLDLSKCSNVKALPEALCSLTQLQYLNLSFCSRLERIPEAIGFLLNLQYFSMSNCWKIKELPESFINLRNLLYLDLKRGQIVKGLEQALPGLTALQYLDISGNWKDLNDVSIHDAMKNLTHLKYLGLSRKKPGLSGIMLEGGCWRVDFIGTLTNLEHLDISCNIWLEYLPESIGNLKKLHTLDVSHCLSLKSLPDSISEITLKSLLIEGCRNELKDLVNSKFHYSLPLPFFKVRADAVSAHSNIRLLEGVNVSELRIFSLGNVRSLEEASEIKMSDKNNLSELILSCSWEGHSLDQKDLLGQLEPPRGLKSLGLECYSSPSFPSWLMGISHHLPNLVRITLNYLPECYNLPPLGQLPNLKVLYLMDCPRVKNIDKDFCGGKGAFRRLSEFCLRRMEALEEWSTTYSVEDGLEEFMFPMLDELEIDNCPSLRLKPRPPVFRNCIIQWSDQVIFSLEELGNNIGRLNSTPSSRLSIRYSMSRSMTLFHHFPALQDLEISICPNLTSVPEGLRNLTSLQSLELWRCESISALPLDGLYSLESLCISECKSIKSFRSCIRQLTKLQTLRIVRVRYFHRARVNLESSRPLLRFVTLTPEGRDKILIQVKYEKLPRFYAHCGLMGHVHLEYGTGEHGEEEL
ncbi:hypothetical protein PR202_gb12437 [Eleusine coracana subsp. coracana]|uniref:Disease resistance protein n=1 Tax=Eleusine coracana subsp. coracana TaxID=191504 RepID=A0AAV5EQH8_ELECO|nr:hypothetical protein PR202_gb12437 [Eleusine coracana subsp. coracana]